MNHLITIIIILFSVVNCKNVSLHKVSDLDTVKKLIANGADVNAFDGEMNTPLHYVDYPQIAEYLIEKGANLSPKNKKGHTPLHVASFENKLEIVKVFVTKNTDLSVVDNDGNTPLHLAAVVGNQEIVTELLKNKANKNLKNNSGKTPLDVAKEKKQEKVILILNPSNAKEPEKWTSSFGEMKWEDAKAKCVSLGLRLPKIEELKQANESGETEKWKTVKDYWYWSATRKGDDSAYGMDIYNGDTGSETIDSNFSVRCIR